MTETKATYKAREVYSSRMPETFLARNTVDSVLAGTYWVEAGKVYVTRSGDTYLDPEATALSVRSPRLGPVVRARCKILDPDTDRKVWMLDLGTLTDKQVRWHPLAKGALPYGAIYVEAIVTDGRLKEE